MIFKDEYQHYAKILIMEGDDFSKIYKNQTTQVPVNHWREIYLKKNEKQLNSFKRGGIMIRITVEKIILFIL